MPSTTIAKVRIAPDVVIGGPLPVIIAGPCVIESRRQTLSLAQRIRDLAQQHGLPVIFKASYDKANRTSHTSYRGPGLDEGLKILSEVRAQTGLPVTTDVHLPDDVPAVAKAVDLVQIPAFLCRQTDLIVAAAESGTAVSIKKGQFLAPGDMAQVVSKFQAAGGSKLVLVERGNSFGYNNLVSDLRCLPIMRNLGVPVIYDGTHSVQMPGGQGTSSGGSGHLAPGLMRAALAVGCEGIFLETHPDPSNAKSDGPNMVPLRQLSRLLGELRAIHDAIGRPKPPLPRSS